MQSSSASEEKIAISFGVSQAKRTGAMIEEKSHLNFHLLESEKQKIIAQPHFKKLQDEWVEKHKGEGTESELIKRFQDEALDALCAQLKAQCLVGGIFIKGAGTGEVDIVLRDVVYQENGQVEIGISNLNNDERQDVYVKEPFIDPRRDAKAEETESKEHKAMLAHDKPNPASVEKIKSMADKIHKIQEREQARRKVVSDIKEDIRKYMTDETKDGFVGKRNAGQFEKIDTIDINGKPVTLSDEQKTMLKKDRERQLEIFMMTDGKAARDAALKEFGISDFKTFNEFYDELTDTYAKLDIDDIHSLGLDPKDRTPRAQRYHECYEMLQRAGIPHTDGRNVVFWTGPEAEKEANKKKDCMTDSTVPAMDITFKIWNKAMEQEKKAGTNDMTTNHLAAICGVFASNATKDVDLYLGRSWADEDAALVAGSVFWNGELLALRHRQQKGEVGNIRVHLEQKEKDENGNVVWVEKTLKQEDMDELAIRRRSAHFMDTDSARPTTTGQTLGKAKEKFRRPIGQTPELLRSQSAPLPDIKEDKNPDKPPELARSQSAPLPKTEVNTFIVDVQNLKKSSASMAIEDVRKEVDVLNGRRSALMDVWMREPGALGQLTRAGTMLTAIINEKEKSLKIEPSQPELRRVKSGPK